MQNEVRKHVCGRVDSVLGRVGERCETVNLECKGTTGVSLGSMSSWWYIAKFDRTKISDKRQGTAAEAATSAKADGAAAPACTPSGSRVVCAEELMQTQPVNSVGTGLERRDIR